MEQLARFISSIGERCQINFGLPVEVIVGSLPKTNYAEAEEFCLGVVRRAVLDKKTNNAKSIVEAKLKQWDNRLKPVQPRAAK
jgi:hypothetical protein